MGRGLWNIGYSSDGTALVCGGMDATMWAIATPRYPISLAFESTEIDTPATVMGTVQLSRPAPPGGVKVVLKSSNAQFTVPGNITIPEGESSGTFSGNAAQVHSVKTARVSATVGTIKVNFDLTLNP
jgi:hypothetical protein